MNIDELREQVPDETSCRELFEKLIWAEGRKCPHCQCSRSYPLRGLSSRAGLYECARCKRQFTVTTRTPMHSTKLPLWKWLLAIYYIINSSKGISSVFLGRLIGVKQSTAWKMGHAIRLMMTRWAEQLPALCGIIEMDEKFIGGKPRHHYGIRHKGGKGSAKQSILVTVQRQGPVFPLPVQSVKTATIMPVVNAVIDPNSALMTDKSYVFLQPGKRFASHQSVYHMAKEYSRGDVHINTAESFGAMLERAKTGVFHYMSSMHLNLYLTELSFRWFNRDPKKVVTKTGKRRVIWKPKPLMEQLTSLLSFACGTQLRWKKTGALRQITSNAF
ncbi:MAG: IS1595 family transposase [Phycisphaerae bacterium]|nr:IS1595 family transposase [Phycisphaerae bacterium]